jgi:hypothetical protein
MSKTSSATARKNVLNSTAKPSTTNMPSNVVRSSPISVSVATRAATVPTKPIGIVNHFRRAERNASAISTNRIVADRIVSGRMAW